LFLANIGHLDLRRDSNKAVIADARNDENVMISQLHAAFIKFYNKMVDEYDQYLKAETYSRARQIVRWAYQYIVVNDYLMNVCDPDVVRETLLHGPYYFSPRGKSFMPLEFSVAGFRFGHSMIRPAYKVKDQADPKLINELLGVSGSDELIENGQLHPDFEVKWSNFASFAGQADPQMARKIDSKIAKGLFKLPFEGIRMNSMMAKLTQRNLLRGLVLSIPTGQSVAKAMRAYPLTPDELVSGLSDDHKAIVKNFGFDHRTPLWFYVLKEAEVQQGGNALGYVGSKLVAETLIGFLKKDPNSYLNNQDHPNVTAAGIQVNANTTIATIADMLEFAGVTI